MTSFWKISGYSKRQIGRLMGTLAAGLLVLAYTYFFDSSTDTFEIDPSTKELLPGIFVTQCHEATAKEVLERCKDMISGRADIIDGDTLRVGGKKIRLWGISAPEMDTQAGIFSKNYLMKLQGNQLVCARKQKQQSYDRIVAQCFDSQGKDIAEDIVSAGHAFDFTRHSEGYYQRFETR